MPIRVDTSVFGLPLPPIDMSATIGAAVDADPTLPTTLTIGTSTATLALPTGYTAYDITLTAPLVTLTLPVVAGINMVTLLLRQDTGNRQVLWPANLTFPGNCYPQIAQGAGATTQVVVVTTDGGLTWNCVAGFGPYPGIDPATVNDVYEAWDVFTQPHFVGQAMTTIYGRKGVNNITAGAVPPKLQISNYGYTASQDLNIAVNPSPNFPALRTIDFSNLGANDAAAGVVNNYATTAAIGGTAAAGWTAIMAYRQRTGVETRAWSLGVSGTPDTKQFNTKQGGGGDPYIYDGAYHNYPSIGRYESTQPHVITAFNPVGGGLMYLRMDGVQITATVAGEAGAINLDSVSMNGVGASTGSTQWGCLIVAKTALDFSTPRSMGSLLERWAGATMGYTY